MKINSVASSNQPVQKIKLPMLLISNRNRLIILATEEKNDYYCGTVLNSGDCNIHDVGDHSITWPMSCFDPYYGEVTVSNPSK